MHLLTLDGFAEKSARQLIDAIDASKRQPLSTLLFALGIRHIGAGGAKVLARHFGTMAALAKAKPEEINRVRGIGEAIAAAVAGFFAEPRNKALVKRLERLGLNMTEPTAPAGEGVGGGRPAGPTYVITGTLPALSRARAAGLIEQAGGDLTDNVSKKTTAVVVGADAGSKVEKARSLGVQVIDEAELLRRVAEKP